MKIKSEDMTWPIDTQSVTSMVFPIDVYRCKKTKEWVV